MYGASDRDWTGDLILTKEDVYKRQITSSFNNKANSFKYIVTIPLGIYTVLFVTASIATPELNPIPLIIALITIVLFTLLAKQYRNKKLPLSICLATPLRCV